MEKEWTQMDPKDFFNYEKFIGYKTGFMLSRLTIDN